MMLNIKGYKKVKSLNALVDGRCDEFVIQPAKHGGTNVEYCVWFSAGTQYYTGFAESIGKAIEEIEEGFGNDWDLYITGQTRLDDGRFIWSKEVPFDKQSNIKLSKLIPFETEIFDCKKTIIFKTAYLNLDGEYVLMQ